MRRGAADEHAGRIMSKPFTNSVRLRLKHVSRKEFVLAAGLSVLLAVMAGVWVAYRIGYFDGQVRCGYPCVGDGHKSIFVDAMRLRIAIGLVVVAIGLCTKRALGFFVAILSLVLIQIQYLYWYLWSIRWLHEVGLKSFSELPSETDIRHALGLYGATQWDILVFGLAGALLLWQVKLLIVAWRLREA